MKAIHFFTITTLLCVLSATAGFKVAEKSQQPTIQLEKKVEVLDKKLKKQSKEVRKLRGDIDSLTVILLQVEAQLQEQNAGDTKGG